MFDVIFIKTFLIMQGQTFSHILCFAGVISHFDNMLLLDSKLQLWKKSKNNRLAWALFSALK